LPIAGSTWTIGLSAPGGLVDKDRRRVALRVCFTVDGEADASQKRRRRRTMRRKRRRARWRSHDPLYKKIRVNKQYKK